jgi:hypothetical protein
VVLSPDVAPSIDSRFDYSDLLQRSVIHYGTAKASAVGRLRAWSARGSIITAPYTPLKALLSGGFGGNAIVATSPKPASTTFILHAQPDCTSGRREAEED